MLHPSVHQLCLKVSCVQLLHNLLINVLLGLFYLAWLEIPDNFFETILVDLGRWLQVKVTYYYSHQGLVYFIGVHENFPYFFLTLSSFSVLPKFGAIDDGSYRSYQVFLKVMKWGSLLLVFAFVNGFLLNGFFYFLRFNWNHLNLSILSWLLIVNQVQIVNIQELGDIFVIVNKVAVGYPVVLFQISTNISKK